MKNIVFILLSFGLAGEMEIDGDLTVLGSVNAPGLGGMKPERIYTFYSYYQFTPLTVPDSKIWRILAISHKNNGSAFQINEQIYQLGGHQYGSPTHEIWALPNSIISYYSTGNTDFSLTIFEYPISASGTSQGMDYVEP